MAHSRRLRFGVELHGPFPGMNWHDTIRAVEDFGYSTVFLPDHFQDQLAPIAAMTAAAMISDRLTVGSLVLDNDYRHPVITAMEMATIDLLSEGRLEFGLGAGWKRLDYDQSGISYDEPKERVDRFMEAVEVIRALFGDDPVDFDGEHYTITGMVGAPRPHTPGGPPLLIAGGARRMLRFAGQHASIVGVNPSIHSGAIDADAARDALADRIDEKFSWVREGAGERYDDIEFNAWSRVTSVTDDPIGFARMIAPAFGIADDRAEDALNSPITMIGTLDSLGEQLAMRRERWGYSYHVVVDEAAIEFAPVVAKYAGT